MRATISGGEVSDYKGFDALMEDNARCAHYVGYGHKRFEAAAQAVAGGAETEDRGGYVCAWCFGAHLSPK